MNPVCRVALVATLAAVRLNKFDLSIAPQSDDRTEFGVFAQHDILWKDGDPDLVA